MGDIHWSAFIAIGITVAIASYFTGMTVFIYIGMVMFAYGLFKFLFVKLRTPKHDSFEEHRIKLEKKAREKEQIMQKHMATRTTHAQLHSPQTNPNQHMQHSQMQHSQQRDTCPRCKNPTHSISNFCHHCGLRLR